MANANIVNNIRLNKDSDWKACFTKACTEASALRIWDIINPDLLDPTDPPIPTDTYTASFETIAATDTKKTARRPLPKPLLPWRANYPKTEEYDDAKFEYQYDYQAWRDEQHAIDLFTCWFISSISDRHTRIAGLVVGRPHLSDKLSKNSGIRLLQLQMIV